MWKWLFEPQLEMVDDPQYPRVRQFFLGLGVIGIGLIALAFNPNKHPPLGYVWLVAWLVGGAIAKFRIVPLERRLARL